MKIAFQETRNAHNFTIQEIQVSLFLSKERKFDQSFDEKSQNLSAHKHSQAFFVDFDLEVS